MLYFAKINLVKYYLFVDESGNHGLKSIDPNFPVFVLCGIIIDEISYAELNSKLQIIKKNFWGDRKVIFHSRDIRKCENEFSILFNPDIKAEFYRQVNELISTSNFTVVSSCIDKNELIKKHGRLFSSVYEIGLSFIIERTVFFLDTISINEKKIHIVIEQRGKREDKELFIHIQRIVGGGTGYVKPQRLAQYIEGVSFESKKRNLTGLQVADLVAYPISRYVIDPERANPAYDLISEKLYRDMRTGKIFGLKIYP
jgi:hypothetical protein